MKQSNLEQVRAAIHEHVKTNNLTLESFARDVLGVTAVSLHNKLTGRTRFYADEAFALADVVGFDVNLFRN